MAKSAAIWLAALIALAAAGCSSTAKPKPGPLSPTQSPTLSSASVSPSSSPSPTPSSSAPPLSPFEADPGVQALRQWAAQAARTINTGHYDDAALNALMTTEIAKSIKVVTGGEVGHYYPGPLPFTPVSVAASSPTERDFHICVVDDGYSLNPKTHKPYAPRHVQAIDAGAQLSAGRWLVSKFNGATFSCAGVKVQEPSW